MPKVDNPHKKATEKPLTPKQLAALREQRHRKMVDENPGAYFVVRGLWCADFVGRVSIPYHRSAEFVISRFVNASTADNYQPGDVLHVVYDTERLTLELYKGL